jgi:5-methylcytosine-specific restriction endonuclease McrA
MSTPQEDTKGITIRGKHNRYMVKKITKSDNVEKMKKTTDCKKLDKIWFSHDFQLQMLRERHTTILGEVKSKLSSYKHQDTLKHRYRQDAFVTLDRVLVMLDETELSCFYCKSNMLLLYEKSREMTQWSVDRINNDIGHNIDNIVISCLKCNLQKKTRDSDKFLNTKQLVITRQGIDD